MKVYNFSAGPAMLPEDVMKIAQAEFCDFKESGSGLIELSHRGKQFTEVIERAVANVNELMNISDDYDVMFIQGGGQERRPCGAHGPQGPPFHNPVNNFFFTVLSICMIQSKREICKGNLPVHKLPRKS